MCRVRASPTLRRDGAEGSFRRRRRDRARAHRRPGRVRDDVDAALAHELRRHGRGRRPRPRLRDRRLGKRLGRRPQLLRADRHDDHGRGRGGRDGARRRQLRPLRRPQRRERDRGHRHGHAFRGRPHLLVAGRRGGEPRPRRRAALVLARLQLDDEPLRLNRDRRERPAAVRARRELSVELPDPGGEPRGRRRARRQRNRLEPADGARLRRLHRSPRRDALELHQRLGRVRGHDDHARREPAPGRRGLPLLRPGPPALRPLGRRQLPDGRLPDRHGRHRRRQLRRRGQVRSVRHEDLRLPGRKLDPGSRLRARNGSVRGLARLQRDREQALLRRRAGLLGRDRLPRTRKPHHRPLGHDDEARHFGLEGEVQRQGDPDGRRQRRDDWDDGDLRDALRRQPDARRLGSGQLLGNPQADRDDEVADDLRGRVPGQRHACRVGEHGPRRLRAREDARLALRPLPALRQVPPLPPRPGPDRSAGPSRRTTTACRSGSSRSARAAAAGSRERPTSSTSARAARPRPSSTRRRGRTGSRSSSPATSTTSAAPRAGRT